MRDHVLFLKKRDPGWQHAIAKATSVHFSRHRQVSTESSLLPSLALLKKGNSIAIFV